jgi:dipeptidyl aminopeptidase/acylaminoacyl peptidase
MKKIFFLMNMLMIMASSNMFAQLPIKAARTISFITEEGSNMSVDLSPDGKTIVFDLLGDLYTVPSKGGTATQITRGIAVNSYPVWSPEGDRIAYRSDASGDDRLTVLDMSTRLVQTFEEPIYRFPVWFGANDWVTASRPSFLNFPLYHLFGGEVKLPKDIYDIVGVVAKKK